MNTFTIAEKHGKNMFRLGLLHAIEMFEIAGEDALPKLKQRLSEIEKAIKEIEQQEAKEAANAA